LLLRNKKNDKQHGAFNGSGIREYAAPHCNIKPYCS
jgi:hypothetical protein